MNDDIKKRRTWIKLYEETGDAGLVCCRCGISRPTLRKWQRHYQRQGKAGLSSHSRQPHHSPNRKVFAQEVEWILELRRTRNLGARRIQNGLKRLHNYDLGLATIQKAVRVGRGGPHPLELRNRLDAVFDTRKSAAFRTRRSDVCVKEIRVVSGLQWARIAAARQRG